MEPELDPRDEQCRLFELSLDLLCVASFDGYFKQVNPAFLHALGYTEEELKTTPFLVFVHADDLGPTIVELERLKQGGLTRSFSNRYRKRDGSYVWFTWTATPDAEKGLIYSVARDTTQGIEDGFLLESIRRIQLDFIRSNSPKEVFDNLLASLIELTKSEYGFIGEIHLKDHSKTPYLKTHAITNLAWDEATRKFFHENAPSGLEFGNLQSLFGYVIRNGKPIISNDPKGHPESCGLPGGHPDLNAFLGVPLYHGKELVGMAGIANRAGGYESSMIDYLQPFLSTTAAVIVGYTSHVQRVEAEQREAQLGRILKDMLHEVYIFDVHRFRFLQVNDAARSNLGYGMEELEKMTPADILMDEQEGCGLKSLLLSLRSDEKEQVLHRGRLCRKDGTLYPVEIHFHRATYDSQPVYVAMTLDITEKIKAEAERESFQKQIQNTQKLESLGVMAGGIAHDFNNLLMGVLGNASLAIRCSKENPEVAEYLRQIELSAIRASELTAQMLSYSGLGKSKHTSFDLTELTEEMISLIRVSIERNSLLEQDLSQGLPAIEGDPAQVRQVMINLVTNASDAHVGKNGRVRVITGTCSRSEGAFDHAFLGAELDEGECVFLEVQDEGQGMTAETIENMFDPFFSTKAPGRGLGMAAVFGIVRSHQGAILMTSEVNRGSRIRVLFPASTAPATSLRCKEEPTVHQDGEGWVLVVDDEESVRSIVRRFLELSGYQVLEAADGVEGLQVFVEHQDQIVAVILDVTMPRLDGKSTLKKMLEIRPTLKAILASGNPESTSLSMIENIDHIKFLQKPYRPGDLLGILQQMLEPNDDRFEEMSSGDPCPV